MTLGLDLGLYLLALDHFCCTSSRFCSHLLHHIKLEASSQLHPLPSYCWIVLDCGTCFEALITDVGLILLSQLRFPSHLLYHSGGTVLSASSSPTLLLVGLDSGTCLEVLIVGVDLILLYQLRFFSYFFRHVKLEMPPALSSC
jgi:hypothetical protein